MRSSRHIPLNQTSLLVLGLLLIGLVLAFRYANPPPRPVTPEDIWPELESLAQAHGLEPHFVLAIARAESGLNAHARNGKARGLMQVTPAAWRHVSQRPFDEAWNWRLNLEVGVAYLALLKAELEAAGQFSYPRLAAAYRFGPAALRRADYDLKRLPAPRNKLYQVIFADRWQPGSPSGNETAYAESSAR